MLPFEDTNFSTKLATGPFFSFAPQFVRRKAGKAGVDNIHNRFLSSMLKGLLPVNVSYRLKLSDIFALSIDLFIFRIVIIFPGQDSVC